jgi:hypothetical protein
MISLAQPFNRLWLVNHYKPNLHLINNLSEKPYLCPPNFR